MKPAPQWKEFYILRPDRLSGIVVPPFALQCLVYGFVVTAKLEFAMLCLAQASANVLLVTWVSNEDRVIRDSKTYRRLELVRFAMNLGLTGLLLFWFSSEVPVWTFTLTGALGYGYLWTGRILLSLYVAELVAFSVLLILGGGGWSQLFIMIALYLMCAFHAAQLKWELEAFNQQRKRDAIRLEEQYGLAMERQATVDALNLELQAANTRLEEQTQVDPLTALMNRRGLSRTLVTDQVVESSEAGNAAVVLIDCDNFKQVNDEHGHAAGDTVLIEVARRLRQGLRGGDFLGRVGGDEFLVVMPDTSLGDAVIAAERLRHGVSLTPFDIDTNLVAMTVSAGVSPLPAGTHSVTDLLGVTREALKNSKHEGRNRVSISD